MSDEQKCSVYFRIDGVEGNSLVKDVKLPWDVPWSRVIHEVATALEGHGYLDVVNRIQVKDVGGDFIPLKDEIHANFW